jgi:hypothetical protein
MKIKLQMLLKINNKILYELYNFKANDKNTNLYIIESSDDNNEINNDLNIKWWYTGKVINNEDKIDVNNNSILNEISTDNDGFDINYEPKTYKIKRNYNELKGHIINYLYNDDEEYKIPNLMPLLKTK